MALQSPSKQTTPHMRCMEALDTGAGRNGLWGNTPAAVQSASLYSALPLARHSRAKHCQSTLSSVCNDMVERLLQLSINCAFRGVPLRLPFQLSEKQLQWRRKLSAHESRITLLLTDSSTDLGNLFSSGRLRRTDDFGYMPRGTNGALRHGVLYHAK